MVGGGLAIYSANYKPAGRTGSEAKLTPAKQVTLVSLNKKTVLSPAQLGWSNGEISQMALTKTLNKVAASTEQKPVDAKIITKNGNYVISPSAPGHEIDVAKAVKMVKAGLFAGQATIKLPEKQIAAKVTEASLQPRLAQMKAKQAAQFAATKAQSVAVTPGSCAGNPAGQKLVIVSISQQHMWACNGSSQAYSTAVTSGAYLAGMITPTGTYHIYSKSRNLYLTGPGYRDFVQYWMPFYSDYGFHDASWQNFPFGSAQYASDGSHGCVHLPTTAAAWLYGWAPIGTTVTIV